MKMGVASMQAKHQVAKREKFNRTKSPVYAALAAVLVLISGQTYAQSAPVGELASVGQAATQAGDAKKMAQVPAVVQAFDGGMVLATGNGFAVTLQDLREASSEFVSQGEQAQFWQSPVLMAEMVTSLYRQQVLAAQARQANMKIDGGEALTPLQLNRELSNAYLLAETQRRMPKADALERYAKAQFNREGAKFEHGEMFMVSHILVTAKPGIRTPEQAQQRAQDAIDRLNQGEEFAVLARELSDDLSTRSAGGALDYREAKELPADFVAVLKTMEVGSRTASPVKTEAGFHVIWLQEMRPPGQLGFDDLRSLLMDKAAVQLDIRYRREVWGQAEKGLVLNTDNLDRVVAAASQVKPANT